MQTLHLKWIAVLMSMGLALPGHAESLFRASVTYTGDAPQTPRSLFTQPRPQHVGDVVTIQVDEQAIQQTRSDLRLNKTHTIEENGTSLFNNAVRDTIGKIPFLGGRWSNTISDKLRVPSFDGLDNENVMSSRAESNRTRQLRESISCQVVQVLPNGHLVVQGRKTILTNKEQTDLFVTGIVNPYYIDRNNQIPSRQVANLQFMMGGKGIISRQQGDGIANKLYQFFQ